MGKEFACNARDAGDRGSIPGFDPWVRSHRRRKWILGLKESDIAEHSSLAISKNQSNNTQCW